MVTNIMPPIRLDSWNPQHVASPHSLEVLVGAPPARLLIFTGIAMPSLESNGQTDGQEVTIDLRTRSNARTPVFTATVGLASIYNTDSDLIFATDDVRVDTGEQLELLLVCNIAVMGDRSVLNRFSYQATVFLHADNGTIAGNIRWSAHDMIFAAARPAEDLFQIEAYDLMTAPDGGLGTTLRTVERVGRTVGEPARQGGALMGIPYEIHDVPLGKAVRVSVVPKPGAFAVPSNSNYNFEQVSGPDRITLSESHLDESPVDFEARLQVGPH